MHAVGVIVFDPVDGNSSGRYRPSARCRRSLYGIIAVLAESQSKRDGIRTYRSSNVRFFDVSAESVGFATAYDYTFFVSDYHTGYGYPYAVRQFIVFV